MSDDLDRKLRETALFVAKIVLAGVIFRAVLYLNPDTYLLQAYLAELTRQILSLVGLELERQGILLLGNSQSYIVVRDCLGWKSVAVFISLIFASTRNLSRHIKTVLVGILILTVANIIRVVSTVYLSYYGIISFDIVHTFLWRWGLTFIVLVLWFIWLKRYRAEEVGY